MCVASIVLNGFKDSRTDIRVQDWSPKSPGRQFLGFSKFKVILNVHVRMGAASGYYKCTKVYVGAKQNSVADTFVLVLTPLEEVL